MKKTASHCSKLRFASLVLLLPPGAVAQTPIPSRVPSAHASEYVLGPNDELQTSVYNQAALSVRVRVTASGNVTLPLIGEIKAAGKTSDELAKDIAQAYSVGGYLNHPAINVDVVTYASKMVTVLGSVINAGLYPLDRPFSVAEMVAKAGGIRPDGANLVILTPAGGGNSVRLPLDDPQNDDFSRQLLPGDKLFVPPAELVYVYGQVNQPGGFAYKPGLTFRQALARAGGPTLAGSTRGIEVRRNGERLKGVSLDDLVKPEDVLIIKEKIF